MKSGPIFNYRSARQNEAIYQKGHDTHCPPAYMPPGSSSVNG